MSGDFCKFNFNTMSSMPVSLKLFILLGFLIEILYVFLQSVVHVACTTYYGFVCSLRLNGQVTDVVWIIFKMTNCRSINMLYLLFYL